MLGTRSWLKGRGLRGEERGGPQGSHILGRRGHGMQAQVEELAFHRRRNEEEEERLSLCRQFEGELLERVRKFSLEGFYVSCVRRSRQWTVRGGREGVSEEKGKI